MDEEEYRFNWNDLSIEERKSILGWKYDPEVWLSQYDDYYRLTPLGQDNYDNRTRKEMLLNVLCDEELRSENDFIDKVKQYIQQQTGWRITYETDDVNYVWKTFNIEHVYNYMQYVVGIWELIKNDVFNKIQSEAELLVQQKEIAKKILNEKRKVPCFWMVIIFV